eukprot:147422_1
MDSQEAVLPESDLAALRHLLFGAEPNPQDVERWHAQGFRASEDPSLPFGLVQLHGGPCGILAPVQAFVLWYFVFSANQLPTHPDSDTPIRPTREQLDEALAEAMCCFIERASATSNFTVLRTKPPQNELVPDQSSSSASHPNSLHSLPKSEKYLRTRRFTRRLSQEVTDCVGSFAPT